MRIFKGFDILPAFTHAVATMGSIDGLHRGHKVLLQRTISLAKERGGESIVLTFEPHPRYVLGTAEGMKLLSTLEEKLWLLQQEGIDNVIIIPFTQEFSRLKPQEFIEKDVAGIGVECFVVGYNHRFGHNKAGNYSLLKESGTMLEIHRVEQQLLDEGKVSSTVIRQRIEQGDMTMAARLLSHPYIIMGEVNDKGEVYNIDKNKLLPPAGVYKTTVYPIDDDKALHNNKIKGLYQAILEVNNNRALNISNVDCTSKVILEITDDK